MLGGLVFFVDIEMFHRKCPKVDHIDLRGLKQTDYIGLIMDFCWPSSLSVAFNLSYFYSQSKQNAFFFFITFDNGFATVNQSLDHNLLFQLSQFI